MNCHLIFFKGFHVSHFNLTLQPLTEVDIIHPPLTEEGKSEY